MTNIEFLSDAATVANTEQADVDRSAERASSAVEVGAPVSPEGAQGSVPADTRLPSSLAAREADESAAPISPSAAHPVEAVADNPQVPRPSATAEIPNPQPTSSPDADKAGGPQDRNEPVSGSPATQFNNPRCLNNCHYAHSRDACHECLVAWSQRPKDEQIRLWSEANEAARAI